ncbi:leucine-rich repeat domain-containing protein [Histomonas meleagridis]|uniref:leucine-rich repeat domain-containing protein n=1 Tax=Histomonas meleagridis TaxID=135588 RepID=UPI00355A14E2|nr:leucine-rich repeat domain-containing protein [Histomonas meleagridis]
MPSQGLQVKANYFDTFLSNHDYKILKISYYSCNAIPNFFSLFLCILVLIILLYINYFSENEFKPKSVETNFFSFLFISFFAQTFQKYINANETLLIYNEKDFWSDHSNTTVSVIIDLNSSIPSGEFGSWPLLTYVYIGDLVTSIGGYAFSYCSNLETVIIGENVKKIGGSAFISCTKLLNITIPSSVTLIGGSAFFNCSRLETVILGESIKEIEDSAFAFCSNLKCIYFYGISEPSIGQNAFSNVSAPVIVLIEYKDKFLGSLAVSNDTTVDGCAPMPTLPFTQSNTFSTSNTFAASLRGDISQTFSFTLTVTLSVSYSLTYSALGTQTLSYYLSNSMITYVETNFIYYSYTVIVYSTYYSYYSNFFTYVYLSPSDASGGMTTAALIGIICGAVAFVLIVVAAVTFFGEK